MAARRTANISLTPELEALVASRIASGRYQTASEVVRAGLRLLEREEFPYAAAMDDLREMVAKGVEQAERGELVDGPAAMARLRAKYAARAGSPKLDSAKRGSSKRRAG